jgi:hypothetical protein
LKNWRSWSTHRLGARLVGDLIGARVEGLGERALDGVDLGGHAARAGVGAAGRAAEEEIDALLDGGGTLGAAAWAKPWVAGDDGVIERMSEAIVDGRRRPDFD